MRRTSATEVTRTSVTEVRSATLSTANCDGLEILQAAGFPAKHGFSTRRDRADSRVAVDFAMTTENDQRAANLARLGRCVGFAPDRFHLATQVHGKEVVVVEPKQSAQYTASLSADALVTVEPQVGLGVVTADCMPVLFACEDSPAVAVAHAGWRGALAGVLQATVRALGELGAAPERIVALVGPCVGPASYEVSREVADRFAHWPSAVLRLKGVAGKPHLDLTAAASCALAEVGVFRLYRAGLCTFADAARFHSYRRDGAAAGRMLGAVVCAGFAPGLGRGNNGP